MDINKLNPCLNKIYDTMQKTQRYIHSEILMAREIGEYSSQVLSEQLTQKFIQKISDQKQHYTMISITYLLNDCKEKILPFKDIGSFDTSNIKVSEEKRIDDQWNFENIISTLKFLNGHEKEFTNLIDFLTFSLIPSLYLNFIDVEYFGLFINFISQLPQTLQPLFSRSLFVSPFFLKFSHLIFYYNLKLFYEGMLTTDLSKYSDNYIKILQNSVLRSIESNISLLPSFIPQFLKIFLDSNEREFILRQAFFEPLINNPIMYSVVDNYVFENDEQYLFISKILQKVLTDDFIHKFNHIIEKSNLFYNVFLNKQAIDKYYPKFRRCRIFSNVDEIIMQQIDEINKIGLKETSYSDNILNNIKEKQLNTYFLFCGIFEEEVNEDQRFFLASQIKDNDGWSYLKEMIKSSPPLPTINDDENNNNNNIFYDYSDDQSVDKKLFCELIDSALVEKYDPLTNISDNLSFLMIEKINLTNYKYQFKEMKTKHTEVEDALSAAQLLQSEINFMSNNIYQILAFSTDYFISYMTKNINPTEIKIPFNSYNQIADPIQTVNNLISYVSSAKLLIRPIIGKMDCSFILGQRFYRNLRFHDFLLIRTDLIKYDQIVWKFLSSHLAIIKNDMTNSRILKKLKMTILYNTEKFDEYGKKIIVAFENNYDPISKTNYVDSIMNELYMYFCDGPNPLGPDDKVNISKFLFAYINPPHLVSNIIFMYEFCNYIDTNEKLQELANASNNIFHRIIHIFSYINNFSLDLDNLPRTVTFKQPNQPMQQQVINHEEEIPWYMKLKKKIFKK